MKINFKHSDGLMIRVGDQLATVLVPDVYGHELEMNQEIKSIIEQHLDAEIKETEFPDLNVKDFESFEVHHEFDGEEIIDTVDVQIIYLYHHNSNTHA